MSGITKILALMLFASFVSAHQNLTCPPSANCSCIHFSNDLTIHCPKSNENQDQIVINIDSKSRHVKYQCYSAFEINPEIIPEFELDGEYELEILNCPLANDKPVTSYMKNIKMEIIRRYSYLSLWAREENVTTKLAKQHFKGLENVEEITIYGNAQMKSLSSDIFSEMPKLKKVTIENMKNVFLPENIFETLENLKYLQLDRLNLPSLGPAFFKNMKNLKVLHLWGNSLTSLTNGTFNPLEMLEELSVSDGEMEFFDPMLLSELKNLKEIYLELKNFKVFPDGFLFTNNYLKTFKLWTYEGDIDALPSDFLANLSHLKIIQIQCNLKHIGEDIFKGSDGIIYLTLSHNQIAELPTNLLTNKKALATLDLSSNLVTEISEILFSDTLSLTELDLSRNKIKHIAEKTFEKLYQLKFLRLGYNQIETLFSTTSLVNLEELILNNNKLKVIDITNFIRTDQKTIQIDLSHNRIKTIIFHKNRDPTELFPFSVKIDLSHNPINCNCKILDFVRYLTNGNKLTLKNPADTTCSEPEHLENQEVAKVEKLKLVCDLDTEASGVKPCSRYCSCFRRPGDDTLKMNCETIASDTIFPSPNETKFKSIELTVENSSLEALPSIKSDGGYKDITKLFLPGNEISRIKLENLPYHLTLLHLKNNKLTTLEEEVIDFLGGLTTLTNLTLSLSGNPWSCECNNEKFLTFVHSHADSIRDYDDLQCSGADGKKLNSLTTGDLCINSYIYIGIVTTLTGLVLGALASCYFKYQKQIKRWLHAHDMCLWLVTREVDEVSSELSPYQKPINVPSQIFEVGNKPSRDDSPEDKIKERMKELLNIPEISFKELEAATGNWDERNVLGRGGFGVVYIGEWISTKVAIKKLECRESKSRSSKEQLLQSLNEMRHLNNSRHDNILPIYGYALKDEVVAVVCQWMIGKSLEKRLRMRSGSEFEPLTWPQRWNIAKGTARGLQYLHRHETTPLIHGDIKPANILLDSWCEPKIADFGLSREGHEQDEYHELSRVFGTLAYIPQELRSKKTFSTKVDVFSFGVVLFELATGLKSRDKLREHEFLYDHMARMDESSVELIQMIIDPTTPNDGACLNLCKLMVYLGKTCCDHSPDERPKMEDVLVALEKFVPLITLESRWI